jgi:hypothetical protein
MPPQACIVTILADCLPKGGAIDARLMEEHFVPQMGADCMGSLHCARARAAVLGCLARGVKMKGGEGGRRADLEVQPDRMLRELLEELCRPRLCSELPACCAAFMHRWCRARSPPPRSLGLYGPWFSSGCMECGCDRCGTV